jgi:PAS domain S-box-containing protein
MSTSPRGIPLSQDAPNSGPVTVATGMPPGAEPTGYLLVPIRKGADFTLYRGRQHGDPSPVLVLAPTAQYPSPESLRRLAQEHSLASEIDPEWAAKPLALTRHEGRTILVLQDPGGEPLDQILNLCQGQPFDLKRALRIAIGLTTALGQLHRRGLIHKDIKPENVLVDDDDRVWLTGFGIASRLPRERQVPAPPETISGTLAYMAPEQSGFMNRSVDSRSDFYSLGVTLYRMLTGALPFAAADPLEWVHCHIARRPALPSDRAAVPEPLCAIVMKLLAKNAEDRYQTALGVAADLQRCFEEWESRGCIEPFELGTHDVPDRLLIPEKLYGRAREAETLLTAFDRIVKGGAPELVLVSGYSGIGKSSVVNELHKVLVPPRGLFASGKFDQYKRDIPYSTLVQAFQSLVRQLLGKSDIELAIWRDALVESLGPNARLMTDLIPELKLIIDEPPPVPELDPKQAQGRFQLVFRRFIGVFARQEHPLALFLDDLQWLDAATLDLLEDLLAQSDLPHLMLIGAYRDNEVDATHPLRHKLDAIRQAGSLVQEIRLTPLACDDVRQLIADALRCSPPSAAPLAQLVEEKTAGNPFFVIQFLNTLAEEGLLHLDHDAVCWSWDLDRIHAKDYTDNVVELLVSKVARLPVKTQLALRQLACLGNVATIAMLSTVLEAPEEQVHAGLWPAARQELVERLEDSYRFMHDRVQEAAYSLVPEALRGETHLRIGRLLAAQTPTEKREAAVFDIVGHLNRGAALITQREERDQLAEFNLIAGKRAKGAIAYASALSYLIAGSAQLAEDRWERRRELTFALELNLAECEFLTGQLSVAEERLAALSKRATTTVEQATVASFQVDVYITLGQNNRAVAVVLDYLRHVGIEWSAHPQEDDVRREYERVWSLLGSRPIEDLIDLPLMEDAASLGAVEVLSKLFPAVASTDANLFSLTVCKAVSLSLEHGNCDASCVAFIMFGRFAGRHFGDYQAGFRFGQLGYDLVERRRFKRFEARTYYVFAHFIASWMKHVRAGGDLLLRAFEVANRSGDLMHAVYARTNLNSALLFAGEPLPEVQRDAEQSLAFATKAHFGTMIVHAATRLALVRMLRGLTLKFGCFDDGQFNELQMECHLSSKPVLAYPKYCYWTWKLQARYLAGDYATAMDAASKAKAQLLRSSLYLEEAEYHFYAALARAACYSDSVTVDEREQHLDALAAHHKQLQVWADNCPENFENRAALVAAEIARIECREHDAMRLYELAIRSARTNGFVHNEAIAYEVAARFYRERGFDQFADVYLRHARYCYLRWGADGKVRQLDEHYPHLRQEQDSASSTVTIGTPVAQLNVETVVRASQALSSEIVLPKLIETLMRLTVEHAGAERGLLILLREDETQIEAEATTGHDRAEVTIRRTAVNPFDIPLSMLHYVIRTRERVLLDDASVENLYSQDEYLRRKHPRSVLCVPIVKQTKLIGVLYLENNLTPRAFTSDRVAVLELLAAQAAISLENADLYSDLQRSETFLAEAQSLSQTGSFGWSVASGELYWSAETFNIFEYDRGEKPTLEMVLRRTHPDDRDLVLQTLGRESEARDDFELEHRLLMTNGSVKHLHVSARALTNSSGDLEFVGAVTDVTKQVQSEKSLEMALQEIKRWNEALRASEHNLDLIINTIPALAWSARPDGSAEFFNQNYLEYVGLSAEQVKDWGWTVAVHPDDLNGLAGLWQSIMASGERGEGEARLRRFDGEYRWFLFRANPLCDESGNIVKWFGINTDIEDRKVAEQRLQNENIALRDEVDRFSMFEEIVGSCEPMRQVLKQVTKVAPSDSTILILGETGTGKELIARALHRRSNRAARAFVRVNCAAIPQSLIASELFGHEKGAFTGALQRRVGRFESADGGTLFLDEIGDLPMETQIALLRVLQEREFERVGSNQPIPVNVRLIAATNGDLPSAVAAGTFRRDLFYRLNVVPIVIPPLRERAEDIPLLVEYFVGRYAKAAGKPIRHICKETLERLTSYNWPGNIRELQNVVERAVILSETDTFFVDESWLKLESAESRHPREGLSTLSDREVEIIEAALAECQGRVAGPSGAAAKLGIPRSTLESKIRSLGISKYEYKRRTS